MARKKKTKLKSNLPTEYKNFKANDEIVYKRISDGKLSIGVIKYFHLGKTACATVIDLQLGNYQTAIVDEIVEDPPQELVRSIWAKITTKSRRAPQSLKRGKTKKT